MEEAVGAMELAVVTISALASTASLTTSPGSNSKVGGAEVCACSVFAAAPTLELTADECKGTMRIGQAGVPITMSPSG